MTDDQAIIRRQTAASGKVAYSKPVEIRTRSQTHFEVLLQYIPHKTSRDELSVKLMYWKRANGKVKFGYPADFTLDEREAIQLRDAINAGLGIAEQGQDGDYLLLSLGQQAIVADKQDAAALGRTVATALTDPAVLQALREDQEGRVILGAVQVAARLVELSQAVHDLETALDDGQVEEGFYQDWCEAHSWAFGNAYAMRDEVRAIALGDNVDILMKHTANGLRDIFELKRPDKRPLNFDESHKSFYWSAEASKAIGQCHRYIDALHDGAREGLRDNRDVVGYHPRAFIVQGRSNEWNEDQLRALHGLNSRLHGVQLMTYDQLLAQAKQLLVVLTTESESNDKIDESPALTAADSWGAPSEPVIDDPWGDRPPF